MKRLSRKSKSGFTLLEVLLATVILVIGSTMIMQGFIFVMVLGANNRQFAKSGDENYRLALSQAVAQHATASNQIDDMNSMTSNNYSVLQPSVNPPVVPSQDLTLVVDLHSYSNSDAAYTVNMAENIDDTSAISNRFAFFYDFNDYMNRYTADSESPHVMRWGYTIDYANQAQMKTSHGEFTTPIYDDRGDLQYYGRFGWYCFNEDHCTRDGDGNITGYNSCRTQPWTGVRTTPMSESPA